MRSLAFSTFLVLSIAVAVAAPGAFAQTGSSAKKTPAHKPAGAAAPAATPKKAIVLGTTQLPGDFGQLGQTYTIGKDSPINFTLTRAEYTTTRFNCDSNTWTPGNEEKLLVLHFTAHNPLPREQRLSWDTFKFTAVDKQDKNHEYIQALTREGTPEAVELVLKPAQKLEVQTAIMVPAEGVVPKLIVQREESAPVVRYDLRGKAQPLAAPLADPADPSGATVRKDIPATTGVYYPYGIFDARVESFASVTQSKLGNETLEEGERFLVATLALRNATTREQNYGWNTIAPELRLADGEKVEYNQAMLRPSRDDYADSSLKPGEEARVRIFFKIPSGTTPKTLILAEGLGNGNGHTFAYEVSDVR